MDPNACVELIVDAINRGELDEAWEHSLDLKRWRDNGGFAPKLNEKATRGVIESLHFLLALSTK